MIEKMNVMKQELISLQVSFILIQVLSVEPQVFLKKLSDFSSRIVRKRDGDSNERRWPAGNQPTDTPSVDKRRDEERGDRSRRARKGRWAGGGGEKKKGRDRPANSAEVTR